jgi:hypothetical protein
MNISEKIQSNAGDIVLVVLVGFLSRPIFSTSSKTSFAAEVRKMEERDLPIVHACIYLAINKVIVESR